MSCCPGASPPTPPPASARSLTIGHRITEAHLPEKLANETAAVAAYELMRSLDTMDTVLYESQRQGRSYGVGPG